jgi:hypothetical protein
MTKTGMDKAILDAASKEKERIKEAQASEAEHVKDFLEDSASALKQFNDNFDKIEAKATKVVEDNDGELKRLTENLSELEARIHESIQRATGYQLFHSFQKRQIELERSKEKWRVYLERWVMASLGVALLFLISLFFVHQFNAAFYLRLTFSIPLIYIIHFCSTEYSKERRLEEEYAFKSNISISLKPYQELVDSLVDKTDPIERAKYSTFIIESVNKVFTSPTAQVLDETPVKAEGADKILDSLPKLIKSIADVVKK